MKFKSFFYTFIIFLLGVFASCDDDLQSIGDNIQPGADGIEIISDSVYLTARTVPLNDSVYAHTLFGLLGKYADATFGSTMGDYLCQFYCPRNASFMPNIEKIDSVRFLLDFSASYGDTTALMGVNVYEVTQKLENNFYTNFDPTKYCDMTQKLGQSAFIPVNQKPDSKYTYGRISIDLGKHFGQKLIDAQQAGHLASNEAFQNFFKGVYVTSELGSGAMLKISRSIISVYYKYRDPNLKGVDGNDSIRTTDFALTSTLETLQLNRVKNQIPSNLLQENTDALYMMSPAGLCTEITLPMTKIVQNMEAKNGGKIDTTKMGLNLATFSIKGFTERETTLGLKLPRINEIVLLNKDSVDSFFKKGLEAPKKGTSVTGIVMSPVVSNTSNIIYIPNLSTLIMHFVKQYLETGIVKDMTFLLLPVSPSDNGNSYMYEMTPRTSILRNNKEDFKLKLIYNKY